MKTSDSKEQIVKVENITKYFTIERPFLDNLISRKEPDYIRAVDDVSFSIKKGETFSLIGETGSGKTTLGRIVLKLIKPTSGNIYFEGKKLTEYDQKKLKEFRREARIVFQDPYASLNPRMTVEEIVGLPVKTFSDKSEEDRLDMVLNILEMVNLTPADELIHRYPHEFSGGQRQRIGIARAIILNPKFIVLDEPVTSLDVSIRAQVLNLLEDLKQNFNLTYLLIAHDFTVVRHMSEKVMVMYLGKPMELASVKDIFDSPAHPYTKALLSAVPVADPDIKIDRMKLRGEMPDAVNPPKGCRFHTRCPFAKDKCRQEEPNLKEIDNNHFVSCHFSA